MPELPEVETIRRQILWLRGREVLAVEQADVKADPRYVNLLRAVGQRILAVERRGKFLILPLSAGDELVIHLGMTGVVTWLRAAQHVRVVLRLSGRDRTRLYFCDPRRFGRLLVVPRGDRSCLPALARMGPEPLKRGFTAAGFHRALQSTSAIKPYLLSQRPVAGLGNIYADEVLWRARLHPLRPACTISPRQANELHAAIRTLLREAVRARGTTARDRGYRTASLESGSFQAKLAVYQRTGEPCRRCGKAIVRIVVAGRGTHFCSRCQRR
ncbi:MAG: bifunctional DNA-formamidopyrimidine glycosylase/DNA-(apurinic or apyrimidinic site) lyase [Deltaproteobacteria bacterium]|nr:bifunctional DNA-formamidopyrimidine glycosylase/DNA-(apurinic or apyrimidinic site) lyase [Deltaproteobacteria bacterium]